jgi:hypothetical protein
VDSLQQRPERGRAMAVVVGSRWGALAEQGEAGSGHGRRPPPALPVRIGRYCPCVGKLNSKQASKQACAFTYHQGQLIGTRACQVAGG